ncbi:MAG TPA: sulfide-dependent adenosine diphosphate thiazole synthase, partial [Candidatus Atribacteria bacterium]|nr:sulfide-dependent adenosine diphosphate thiazole synthase [Candidatus Atribacteria bacterium]
IVIQEDARRLLDEFEVRTVPYKEPGYYTASSVESVSTITSKAVKAGLSVFNGVSVEDVVVKNNNVSGLVINWTATSLAGLHVDPLSVRSRLVIDATGHDTEVVAMVERKAPGKLLTPTGKIEGEKFMDPEEAERLTLENTREVFPGLYVAGMACNATFGGPRMGPIFGGMLLSGEKVARLILKELSR